MLLFAGAAAFSLADSSLKHLPLLSAAITAPSMSPTATRPQTRQTTPPKSSLNAAVSPAALNRPHARLSKATITELGRLWSINPQLPSASSIDAWAALRNLQAHKIHRWFTRRRPVAKRAGLILVEDEYDLPLDPPPAPPPVKISRKNEIRVKRELLSPSPSPFKQPGIKLEDDATSGSDDTLVASSPAPSKSIINHVSAYTRSSRRLRALSPIDIKALLSSPDVESCPNSPEPSSPSRSPSPAFIYPQLSLDDAFCLDDAQPQDVDDPVEKLLCCGGGSASGSGSGFVCVLCRPLGNLPFSFALVSISASLAHCLFVLLCTHSFAPHCIYAPLIL